MIETCPFQFFPTRNENIVGSADLSFFVCLVCLLPTVIFPKRKDLKRMTQRMGVSRSTGERERDREISTVHDRQNTVETIATTVRSTFIYRHLLTAHYYVYRIQGR